MCSASKNPRTIRDKMSNTDVTENKEPEMVLHEEVGKLLSQVIGAENGFVEISCALPSVENYDETFPELSKSLRVTTGVLTLSRLEFWLGIRGKEKLLSLRDCPDEWLETLYLALSTISRNVEVYQIEKRPEYEWLDVAKIRMMGEDGEEVILMEVGTIAVSDNVVGIFMADHEGKLLSLSSFYKDVPESVEVALKDLEAFGGALVSLETVLLKKIEEKSEDYVQAIVDTDTE